MKLRGRYDQGAEYQVNDVVLFEDGSAYRLMTPATSGVPPVDTAYWERLDPVLSECAQMILSCMVPVEAPKKTTRKKEASK